MGGVISGERQKTTASKKISSLVVILRSNKPLALVGFAGIALVGSMMVTLFYITQSSPQSERKRNCHW
jgi:hypothetical protein